MWSLRSSEHTKTTGHNSSKSQSTGGWRVTIYCISRVGILFLPPLACLYSRYARKEKGTRAFCSGRPLPSNTCFCLYPLAYIPRPQELR